MIKVIWNKAGLWTYVAIMTGTMVSKPAMAQVDVTAPLEQLKKAREAAKNSNLQVDNVQTGLGKVLDIIIILGGVMGVGLALYSAINMYKGAQDEQSRESVFRSSTGLIIGSGITIIAVVVGWLTGMMTGGGS